MILSILLSAMTVYGQPYATVGLSLSLSIASHVDYPLHDYCGGSIINIASNLGAQLGLRLIDIVLIIFVRAHRN